MYTYESPFRTLGLEIINLTKQNKVTRRNKGLQRDVTYTIEKEEFF